jgi:hypothetical protein
MLSLVTLLRDGFLADVQLTDTVVQASAEVDEGSDRDPEQGIRLFSREIDSDMQARRCRVPEERLPEALICHQLSHGSLDTSLAHDTTSSFFSGTG